MAPNLIDKSNEHIVRQRLFPPRLELEQKPATFKVNDRVRLALAFGPFDKSYHPNWSSETYSVAKVIPSDPPVYELLSGNKIPLLGYMYGEELIKVP